MLPDTLFMTFFVIVFILAALAYVLSLFRSMKSRRKLQEQNESEVQPTIKEREIIREIGKIRCPYCGNLYDEKEDKYPYCAGKQS